MEEHTVGWILGALLSAVACVFTALGDNLVKKSYNVLNERALDVAERWSSERKSQYLWPNVLFVSGWASTGVFDTLCNAWALFFAPASIVMPLAALHIVFNIFFARCINSEKASGYVLGCTFLIVVGTVAVVLAGPENEVEFSKLEPLLDLLQRTRFLIYAAANVALLSVMCVFMTRHATTTGPDGDLLVAADPLPRFATIFVPGLIGSFTNGFLKIWMKALGIQTSESVWERPEFYIVTLCMIGCAVGQIVLLNNALSKVEASIVVPVYSSCLICLGSMCGMILFQEYDQITSWAMASVYVCGIILTVVTICAMGLATVETDAPIARLKEDIPEEDEGQLLKAGMRKDVEHNGVEDGVVALGYGTG